MFSEKLVRPDCPEIFYSKFSEDPKNLLLTSRKFAFDNSREAGAKHALRYGAISQAWKKVRAASAGACFLGTPLVGKRGRRMKIFRAFLLGLTLASICFAFPLAAQGTDESIAEQSPDNAKEIQEDDKPVLLRKIEIRVKGWSNKSVLRNRIGVKEGDTFHSLRELQNILDIGFNDLRGTGYFKKDDGIPYHLIPEEGGGDTVQWVRLEADFQDEWTIYPVPYPYYSTNSGFGIRGRLKWDNFLGLLGNVTFRVDVTEVRNGRYGADFLGGISISTIKITPNFGINGSFHVQRDARVDGANWLLGAGVGAILNIGLLRSAGIGMSYSIRNNSNIAFGYTGNVTTHPHFSTGFSHNIGLEKMRYSSGSVFRDGYSMSLSNSYSMDSNPGNLNDSRAFALEDIQFNYSLRLARSYFDILNFKGRLGVGKSFDFANGVYKKDGYNYDVGNYNRGQRNRITKGNFIAYLNMELGVLVFSDKLLGDVMFQTFLDVAWVNNDKGFALENTSLGSGFELIWIFRSLNMRFSFGFDLEKPEMYNITITTGFYF